MSSLQSLQHEVKLHGAKLLGNIARLYKVGGIPGPKKDSISCPVGQNFLEESVRSDTFSWRTDFPLTME